MSFNPSPQQSAFFSWLTEGSGSCVLEAVAGSGKTTTIVEGSNLLPSTVLIRFLAFNKNIVEELKRRLRPHVQVGTFHSVCLAALSRSLPRRPKIDANKVRELLRQRLDRNEFELYFAFVSRLVSYAKSAGVGTDLCPDTPDAWWGLISHFNLTLDSESAELARAVDIARRVLAESSSILDVIDFDDMLYLALLRNAQFDKAAFVFVDEAQDTNGVQRALLHRMLAPNGRLIAVGDPAQAIYGFRGADSDSIGAISREFNCVTLPLSVSYRCSRAVVQKAQTYVEHISFHEAAPDGLVEVLDRYDAGSFAPTGAILCRNTAPLVSFAFSLLRRDVGCRVLGREIGAGLITLVKKLNAISVDDFLKRLEMWELRETQKFLAKGEDASADAVRDRADCLRLFAENVPEDDRSVAAVCRKIESLFSDTDRGLLTLATVHKAKGLEWPDVFILDFDKYMPSKWARQPWQQRQEQNLIYVAVTRAKLNLRFIESGRWKVATVVTTAKLISRADVLDSI